MLIGIFINTFTAKKNKKILLSSSRPFIFSLINKEAKKKLKKFLVKFRKMGADEISGPHTPK